MDFEGLNSKFLSKLYAFIDNCKAHNIVLDFKVGYVSLDDQAQKWKRSRSDSQIDATIAELQASDAPFLAEVIAKSKSSLGQWATDDLPGFSWHNWGQAHTFCVIGEDGKPIPETNKIYAKVAELAKDSGLTAGYNFKPKAPGLVQLSPHKQPANTYSLQQINKEMECMYGQHE